MLSCIEKYDAACARYLHRCEKNKLSTTTVENYSRRLSAFRAFLAESDAQEISYATVEAWRDALDESGLSASTINRYLGDLSIFFTALQKPSYPAELRYDANYVSDDFYEKSVSRPYTHLLPDSAVSLLWRNKCPDGRMKATWPRNYAIVVTLLAQKIRNSELLDLRLSDVHFDEQYMVVRCGKGGKYREMDLEPICATAIQLYLQSGMRPANLSDDDYLFGTTAAKVKGAVGEHGEEWHRMSRQFVSQLVERHVAAVTGETGYRSHAMRHAGAKLCLNTGDSMEQIQADLGHSDLRTTAIYSGRLQTRRNRAQAQDAVAERDRQARYNEELLALRSVALARRKEELCPFLKSVSTASQK